eukprot:TRINITY_DN5444_c0_g1_i1.p1 TRINITY_DN5444_c0_g1~~TRINITY_DN5444_c0_g1_i1.p1  ORF type:complete len:1045 (+),score=257.84 TRINITY_DN5444_c0_g1_i1:358-3135(+)
MTPVVGLVGLLASLHFRYLRSQSPALLLVMERALFACAPLPISVLLTWAAAAVAGIRSAAFFLALLLCATHFLFVLPLPTAFPRLVRGAAPVATADSTPTGATIQSRFTQSINTAAVLFLPSLFHLAIHHSPLTYGETVSQKMRLICDVAALFALPLLYLALTAKRGSLSCFGVSQTATLTQGATILVAVAILVGCFEYRVVFISFGHYIQLAPPLNYVVVTLALYISLAVAAAHVGGYLTSSVRIPMTAGLVLAAVAFALILALPPLYMFAPILSAVSFTGFYFTRSVKQYMVFYVATLTCAQWLVTRLLMVVNYTFSFLSLPLSTVALLIVVLLALTLLIPALGLVETRVDTAPLTGILLFAHAVGLAFLEQIVFAESAVMYHPLLIVFTSCFGVFLAYSLYQRRAISELALWCLVAVYISKLILLLDTEPLAQPVAFLLLCTSAPLYLYPSTPKMSKRQGFAHAAGVAFACFVARKSVLYHLLNLWLPNPSNESLIAWAVFATAIGTLPLSSSHFPHLPAVRQGHFMLFGFSALLAFIQPPLAAFPDWMRGIAGIAALPDQYDSSTSSVWSWALLAGAVLLIVSSSSSVSVLRWQSVRVLGGVAAGTCFGLYAGNDLLPGPVAPTALAMAVATSIFIVLVLLWLDHPIPAVVSLLPLAYAAALAGFGALFAFFADPTYSSLLMPDRQDALFVIEVWFASANLAVALLVKARSVSTTSGVRQSTTAFDALPKIGAIAVFCSILAALHVSVTFLGGSEWSVLGLAPLVLLLSHDLPYFVAARNVREAHYCILFGTVSILLLAFTIHDLVVSRLLPEALIGALWLPPTDDMTLLSIALNGAAFVATAPTHFVIFAAMRSMRASATGGASSPRFAAIWYYVGPLNVIGVLLAVSPALRLLALHGTAVSGLRILLRWQSESTSKRAL